MLKSNLILLYCDICKRESGGPHAHHGQLVRMKLVGSADINVYGQPNFLPKVDFIQVELKVSGGGGGGAAT